MNHAPQKLTVLTCTLFFFVFHSFIASGFLHGGIQERDVKANEKKVERKWNKFKRIELLLPQGEKGKKQNVEKVVKGYFNSNACVCGKWVFSKETKSYYVGELHYPTENTADYEAKGAKQSPLYYMVTNVRVRKRGKLPIDLKQFKGSLILSDPHPDKPITVRGDDTVYGVVGYERPNSNNASFFFRKNRQFKFQQKSKK